MEKPPSLSSFALDKLTAGHEIHGVHSTIDPEEVHKSAIFYSGKLVYLLPNIKVGNPDALTPSPGLNIPTSRARRTEMYHMYLKKAAVIEQRKKMSKSEREEEQRKSREVCKEI
jgi:hypothetical protein